MIDSGNGNTISATTSATNNAVWGVNNSTTTSKGANGGFFITYSTAGSGIVAENLSQGTGNNYAAYLWGNVEITGSLTKGSGSFKIDHPLDPANKYLSHSFVESPDMMNVYNGNIRTDKRGWAVVVLPDYFEALNRDFRYQLTVIGQFAQAIVARKIAHNRFVVRTNKPGVEVSWQVTGIRHDAYADAHRIPTEEMKPSNEQGRYLHPELFGAPPELAIGRLMMPTRETAHPDLAPAEETTANSRNAALGSRSAGCPPGGSAKSVAKMRTNETGVNPSTRQRRRAARLYNGASVSISQFSRTGIDHSALERDLPDFAADLRRR